MEKAYIAMLSASFIVSGVFLSLYAYLTPPSAFNYFQALGSVVFWAGVFMLLATYFIGGALGLAVRFGRTLVGAVVGVGYVLTHLLLYGFVLEGILVYAYKIPPFVSSSFVYVSTSVLYPASFTDAVLGLTLSPSVNLQLAPIFEVSLSSFSIFTAVVIDLLILANLSKVREIGKRSSTAAKSRAYIVMPAAGIFLGASCCMSLPVLLSIVAPSLEGISSFIWAFYVTYFLFPPLAIVILKLNLDLGSRVSARAESLSANPTSDGAVRRGGNGNPDL